MKAGDHSSVGDGSFFKVACSSGWGTAKGGASLTATPTHAHQIWAVIDWQQKGCRECALWICIVMAVWPLLPKQSMRQLCELVVPGGC